MLDDTDIPDPLAGLEALVRGSKTRAHLLFRIHQELSAESDRGCALVAAAYLDKELEVALRLFFVERIADAMFEFNGPAGTFSAKILLAHANGLIADEVRASLDLLRKIRNDFAHLEISVSFESESVRSRIGAIAQHLDEGPNSLSNSRDVFIDAVVKLAGSVHMSQAMAYHRTTPTFQPLGAPTTPEQHRLEIAARRLMAITAPEISYEQAMETVREIAAIPFPEQEEA